MTSASLSPVSFSPAEVQEVRRGKMPIGESITRGALALLSTQPLTWGASLLSTIVLPRMLGADALGQFTIASTIVAMAVTATSLGNSDYLVRRFAQQADMLRRDLAVGLLLQVISMVCGVIIVVLLAGWGKFPLADPRLLYLALLGMLVAPAQSALLASFRGRELHTHYAWFNAIAAVAGQLLGVGSLFMGGDVLAYSATVGVSGIAMTLIGWKLANLRLSLPRFDRALLHSFREQLSGGIPFWTWSLTLTLTSGIDRVLLGAFVPTVEVGWYAAAYRIFSIPVFIPTLIVTPLFPALSRSIHEPEAIKRTVTRTLRVVLLMMVPLCAGTIVVAPAIPSLLGWTADFDNAVPLMSLLSLQLPLVAVDMVLGVVLMVVGRQRAWAIVGLSTAILKVGTNLAAIPAFESLVGSGAIGASIVTLLTEVVMLVCALILIPKNLLDLRTAWDAVRITIAGAATVSVGVLLMPFALWLAIIGGAVTYAVIAILLRVLRSEDVLILTSRLRSPRGRV